MRYFKIQTHLDFLLFRSLPLFPCLLRGGASGLPAGFHIWSGRLLLEKV